MFSRPSSTTSTPSSEARSLPTTSTSPRSLGRSNDLCSSTTLRSSILLMSSTLLIRLSRWSAATWAFARFCATSSASSLCASLMPKSPMMPFSGVRMSRLMRARNADLAALAACASAWALRAAQRPGEDGHRGQEHHRGASDKPRLVESHELDERGFLLAVGVVGIGARDEVLFGVSDALVHDGQQHRVVLAHPHRETHRAR